MKSTKLEGVDRSNIMKSIILEGIDGVGKSTLARELGAYYNMGVHSIGGPPPNNDTAQTMSGYQVAIASSSIVVFDRVTSISRLCYEKDLSVMHVKNLGSDSLKLLHDCILIWVTNPVPINIVKEYDTDKHLKAIKDNEIMIKDNYQRFMSSVPHFHYDYTEMSFKDLIEELNNADV